MNIKRFIPAVLAVYVFVFLFDWVFHGVLLHDAYQATASLWRPEAEMQQYFYFMLLAQFILALFFCLIFVKGYEARGLLEGARFGIYIAFLLASKDLVMYAVQPIPQTLVIYWMVGILVEAMLAGMLIAAIYRR